MRIALGADHAGYELKEVLKTTIEHMGHSVADCGAHSYDALDDYPDFAVAVARTVAAGQADRGVVVCGSGIGACIAANKVRGVRAGIGIESYTSRQGVEHDDMNVLVIGARVTGEAVVLEALRAFLDAKFSAEERHVRRKNKVLAIEAAGS